MSDESTQESSKQACTLLQEPSTVVQHYEKVQVYSVRVREERSFFFNIVVGILKVLLANLNDTPHDMTHVLNASKVTTQSVWDKAGQQKVKR